MGKPTCEVGKDNRRLILAVPRTDGVRVRRYFLKGMKYTPIIFNREMVRAILEGRKTQTRIIISPQPDAWIRGESGAFGVPCKFTNKKPGQGRSVWQEDNGERYEAIPCPFGTDGDRIWVRETFAKQMNGAYTYKADVHHWLKPDYTALGNWTPSIHMPREASRITLEVDWSYADHLCDISEEDAIAEGIEPIETGMGVFYGNYGKDEDSHALSPVSSFRSLWESIYGAGSWAKNPYVWVVKFKLITI